MKKSEVEKKAQGGWGEIKITQCCGTIKYLEDY